MNIAGHRAFGVVREEVGTRVEYLNAQNFSRDWYQRFKRSHVLTTTSNSKQGTLQTTANWHGFF